jgi:hypothetical protein
MTKCRFCFGGPDGIECDAHESRCRYYHMDYDQNGKLKGAAQPEPEIPIWTTATGLKYKITDMTDDHLRNTIFYLNKRFGQLSHDIMMNTPAEKWPIYDDMRREADRRKLGWMPMSEISLTEPKQCVIKPDWMTLTDAERNEWAEKGPYRFVIDGDDEETYFVIITKTEAPHNHNTFSDSLEASFYVAWLNREYWKASKK